MSKDWDDVDPVAMEILGWRQPPEYPLVEMQPQVPNLNRFFEEFNYKVASFIKQLNVIVVSTAEEIIKAVKEIIDKIEIIKAKKDIIYPRPGHGQIPSVPNPEIVWPRSRSPPYL